MVLYSLLCISSDLILNLTVHLIEAIYDLYMFLLILHALRMFYIFGGFMAFLKFI